MEANTALRSRLKRQFEEDGGSSKAPEEKRIRFPKGKKAKAGEEVIKTVPIGAEEEGPTDLADPRVAAKERAKRRSQMTTELLRDEGRANDITAAEVEYEDNTTFVDEGIQIEPFNLKQELEEGYFDADGNFVEYVKDGNQIKDAWLDSVDTVYRENSSYMGNIEKGYDDLSSGDIQKINRRIADVLEPGETVPRALRRLKGTTNSKKDKMPAEAKRMFDQLTEDSSKLIENGDQDVYDHKREDFEREAGNDADDFDIFGDDDEKPVADHIGFGATSEPDIQPSSENSHTISESWEGQTDYVYDESSGYYYSSTLGYYYDPTSGLYCSASSGIWYSFNEQTGSYDEIQGEAAVPVSVT